MTNNSDEYKSTIDMPSSEQLDKAVQPYSDEELTLTPELESKINKLLKFFESSPVDYSKFKETSSKQAYPNTDQYMYIPGQHNTNKWLNAVKEIFIKEKDGLDRVKSIRHITSGWNVMETYDFLHWLRFYESGDHMKYKFAQLWYENGAPGYFLHVKKDPVKEDEVNSVSGKDIDFAKDSVSEETTKSERNQIIEKQRNKIIGRLDSAEKLLRSRDGQIFSGKEFESLMESIYQLKKQIQMVNKVSTSTRIYEDMIVREANILNKNGFFKAADTLYSIAQTPAAAGEAASGTGTESASAVVPAAPEEPTKPTGAPGGLPSVGPGMPQPPGSPPSPLNENAPSAKSLVSKPKGISDFLDAMETSNLTTKEDNAIDDNLEVEDSTIDVYNVEDELLVTEAQAMNPLAEEVPMTDSPAPAKLNPSPIPAPAEELSTNEKDNIPENIAEEPLEVTEDDIPDSTKLPVNVSDFDNKIDVLFENLTIDDVVAKLEDLAKIFKTREVPRQLAIVDMMLDALGLASYFPSLSEAQNKALDSNTYISTRIEDILSQLRGSLVRKEVDLRGENKKPSAETADIRQNLKDKEEKEKTRKQMKKDREDEDLSGVVKETPDVEIKEDLAPITPPAKLPAVKPQAVKPLVTPTV